MTLTTPAKQNNRRLYLQLGRLGDIINILPAAHKHWQDTGERPYFMAAEEFARK